MEASARRIGADAVAGVDSITKYWVPATACSWLWSSN